MAPLASAQYSGRLVGYSQIPGSKSGAIHAQDILKRCPPAFSLCRGVLSSPLTIKLPIGGSAWDSRSGLLWACDDMFLAAYSIKTCSQKCRFKSFTMDSKAVPSGLAIAEHKRQLWMLETRPGYLGLRPWSLNGCKAVPTRGGCSFRLPNKSMVSGGLAYDEGRDLLYYTVSEPQPLNWVHTLFVAKAGFGSACRPICKYPLKHCSLVKRAITGLTFDPWTQQLFATDGQNTRTLRVVDPLKCRFVDLGCCKKGMPQQDWLGLAWQPAFAMTRFGKGCSKKPCANCPSPLHGMGPGSPSIGNTDFTLTLRSGPTGSYGIFLLSPGSCTKGLAVPFLCTAIYPATSPAPLVLNIGALQGYSSCDGALDLRLPLPPDSKLCGAKLCSQWLMLCAGPGFAVSNALQWQITGG
ncbi:MAG: hypothetical protein CSA62_04325 [Planctomycetota bacterium]|nr:MAG: hypothetical protein CSA62_04325 [Planctomycetota bacterium]